MQVFKSIENSAFCNILLVKFSNVKIYFCSEYFLLDNNNTNSGIYDLCFWIYEIYWSKSLFFIADFISVGIISSGSLFVIIILLLWLLFILIILFPFKFVFIVFKSLLLFLLF